jgi:4-alpha-glucanotransferase
MARAACHEAAVGADIDREPSWAVIELALKGPCGLAMLQAQDVLALGSAARMNEPGVEGGWRWQMEPGALTEQHAQRLRALTEASERARPDSR